MILFGVIFSLALVAQEEQKLTPPGSDVLKPVSKDVFVVDPLRYTYNPFGKRDPFKSFLLERTRGVGPAKDPLLSYQLTQFKLTGIVWGITNPKAIVVDGGGRGHVISRGTRIGRNKGRVTRILKDRVVVSEQFRDPLGKLIISKYEMKLKKDELVK